MWLSRRFNSKESYVAEVGRVTVNSENLLEAAGTESSRNAKSFSPYGYSCSAPAGEKLLMINSASGAVSAGTEMTAGNLASGEISIASLGGAKIILHNNGNVEINGVVIDRNGIISNAIIAEGG